MRQSTLHISPCSQVKKSSTRSPSAILPFFPYTYAHLDLSARHIHLNHSQPRPRDEAAQSKIRSSFISITQMSYRRHEPLPLSILSWQAPRFPFCVLACTYLLTTRLLQLSTLSMPNPNTDFSPAGSCFHKVFTPPRSQQRGSLQGTLLQPFYPPPHCPGSTPELSPSQIEATPLSNAIP